MKTIASFAATHLLLIFLVLGLLCTPFLFAQFDSLNDLFQECKSQWQSFANGLSGSGLQAHRTQW